MTDATLNQPTSAVETLARIMRVSGFLSGLPTAVACYEVQELIQQYADQYAASKQLQASADAVEVLFEITDILNVGNIPTEKFIKAAALIQSAFDAREKALREALEQIRGCKADPEKTNWSGGDQIAIMCQHIARECLWKLERKALAAPVNDKNGG